MHTDQQLGADFRSRGPTGAGGRLVPVLTRALELRRGPPGLVRWLSSRQTGAGDVARLAAELGQVVHRAGVAETLAE